MAVHAQRAASPRITAPSAPSAAPTPSRASGSATATYAPGRCNIGAAEIARRRRFGHLGLAITIALLAVLFAVVAPREARLLLFFPAAGSAIGYLQARLRFCAAFGLLGIFNFGPRGGFEKIVDAVALRDDRRRAWEIVLASAGIGALVAAVAYLI